jgi:hypothetical protein
MLGILASIKPTWGIWKEKKKKLWSRSHNDDGGQLQLKPQKKPQKKKKKKPIIGKTQFRWFEQEQDPIFSNI